MEENPGNAPQPNPIIQNLQNQINALSQQLNNANQAYINLTTGSSSLKTAKPDKFSGVNVRSWLKSLENIFEDQNIVPNEHKK